MRRYVRDLGGTYRIVNLIEEGDSIGATTPAAGAFTTLSASGLVSADGGQIKFPATQNASSNANTLDDYEEGTWTPVLTFATPGNLSVAYTTQAGHYTKIGRFVQAFFNLVLSTFTHTTASGNLQITGLPFAPGIDYFGMNSDWTGITKAGYTQMSFECANGTTFLLLVGFGSGVARSAVTAADMPTGGTVRLRGNVIYHV